MPTESALDVERAPIKETTPATSEINEAYFAMLSREAQFL